jgi:hypothetical protein
MSREEYVTTIKKYTERFNHLWIIPQVVASTGQINEEFSGYDITDIMDSMIPDDLQEFYAKVKARINN